MCSDSVEELAKPEAYSTGRGMDENIISLKRNPPLAPSIPQIFSLLYIMAYLLNGITLPQHRNRRKSLYQARSSQPRLDSIRDMSNMQRLNGCIFCL